MSWHREDWAKAANSTAAWFAAHQSVTMVLCGILIGIIVTAIFTWG
jgi:hypothetical protein